MRSSGFSGSFGLAAFCRSCSPRSRSAACRPSSLAASSTLNLSVAWRANARASRSTFCCSTTRCRSRSTLAAWRSPDRSRIERSSRRRLALQLARFLGPRQPLGGLALELQPLPARLPGAPLVAGGRHPEVPGRLALDALRHQAAMVDAGSEPLLAQRSFCTGANAHAPAPDLAGLSVVELRASSRRSLRPQRAACCTGCARGGCARRLPVTGACTATSTAHRCRSTISRARATASRRRSSAASSAGKATRTPAPRTSSCASRPSRQRSTGASGRRPTRAHRSAAPDRPTRHRPCGGSRGPRPVRSSAISQPAR